MLIDAVIRNFEIIGEAAANFTDRFMTDNTEIPVQQMKSMRNVLIHQYFGVDVDIVWHTIEHDIDMLEEILLKKVR